MPVYLDYASTAPLHPAARAALLTALDDGWADPARLYRDGRRAGQLLDAARETVAGVLRVRPDEVSFTASGTQAAHAALLGTLAARRRVGNRLLVSAVEHSCVLNTAQHHAAQHYAGQHYAGQQGAIGGGGEFTAVGVDRHGRIDPDDELYLNPPPGTALASLQHANHEVGTIQPVAAVAERLHAAGVPLHCDAAMTVGRLPVDVPALGADLVTASAHKFGGPAGVGILVVRGGTRWVNPLPSDSREFGRAAGFPNLPAVVAAAVALHARAGEIVTESPRLAGYVDDVRRRLPELVGDVDLLGPPDAADRLPHLVAFSCLYVDGEALLGEVDRGGLAVSSGSSCASDTAEPSHVLAAMGALTHGNVRVSFGRGSTAADVEALFAVLPGAIAAVRGRAGVVGL